jgi:predicted metalloprotease with PDZ domain
VPWNDFFRTVGLHIVETSVTVADPGFTASRNFDGPMSVEAVTAGSEAERAGLRVGDVIVEIQGKTPGAEMAHLNPGDTINVKVRGRRVAERELSWKVGSGEEKSYEVKDLENVAPAQSARRAAWLRGEAESKGDASQ